MPEISRFYGIVITMYPEAGERHSSPHLHARYGGSRATMSVERPQMRMVQAWIEMRRLQLDANWNLLIAGQTPEKIEPLRWKSFMHHEIQAVTDFAIVAPYTLRIHFADGHVQIIDFQPMLRGEMFGPLRDLTLFNGVILDEEAGTLVWPNGADFDPATLHDWDRVGPAMIRMAQSWSESVVPIQQAATVAAH